MEKDRDIQRQTRERQGQKGTEGERQTFRDTGERDKDRQRPRQGQKRQ